MNKNILFELMRIRMLMDDNPSRGKQLLTNLINSIKDYTYFDLKGYELDRINKNHVNKNE